MRIALTAVGILIVVPSVAWLGAMWIDFWVRRSVGEWMCFGCGLPVAVAIATIYVWGSISEARSSK